ncbi:MAG: ADP-ribosylglycohydrolase family protein, partial [Chloroflexi bacterium]|nr:ADP-ribosylglycohydrolase family protein [Chloroflexota bacterium]
LTGAFPDWGYLGEETGARAPAGGETHLWLVDPNDGTEAMQLGYRGHAVSIGLLRDGVPVLGVVHAVDAPDDGGDCIAWAEGRGPLTRKGAPVQRDPWPERLGPDDVVIVSQAADRHPAGNLACVAPARFMPVASIAYRLALVAAGEGAAGVSLSYPVAWDYGAGHALLRGVGGTLVNESGEEVRDSRDGRSGTMACFGGGPAVVQQLSQANWSESAGSGFGQAAVPTELEPARLAAGRLIHDTAVPRRAQGCLLGQIAGDALGALVEFQPAAAIARAFPDGGPRLLAHGGPHEITAGQPTDDSELALLLARTIVAGEGFDPEAVAVAYARWYHGWTHQLEPCQHHWCRPFDVGSTTARALGAISLSDARSGTAAQTAMRAASRSSQANGALMRVSPLGIWGWQHDPRELADAARADARLTHPHPVCQEASAVFTVAIAAAIREGRTPRATYEGARAWARKHCLEAAVVQVIEHAAAEPPADYLSQQGWVLVALQNAFYQLLHAPSAEEAVVRTVRAGGDTDTNGAICGALVGAVHGRDALPVQWRRAVLTCRPMPGDQQYRRPRPAMFWPADALTLAERLLQ